MSATSTTTMSVWEAEYDTALRARLADFARDWARVGVEDLAKFTAKINDNAYDVTYQLQWEGEGLVRGCEFRRAAAAISTWLEPNPDAPDEPADVTLRTLTDHLDRLRDEAVTHSSTGLFWNATARAAGRAALDMLRDLRYVPSMCRTEADRAVSPDAWVAREEAYRTQRDAERKLAGARSDRSRGSWQAVINAQKDTIATLGTVIADAAREAGRPS